MDQAALEFVLDLQDRASDGLRAFDRVLAGVGGAVPDITGAVDIVTAGAEASLERVGDAGGTLEPALAAAGAAAGARLEDGIVSGTAGIADAVQRTGQEAGQGLGDGVVEGADDVAPQLEESGAEGGRRFGDGLRGAIDTVGPQVAVAAAAIGVAAGAAIVSALGTSLDIESANAKLTGQLGLTAEESGRYGQLAGSLYSSNYGGSLEEVNGSIAAVVSSIGGIREASDADLKTAAASALNFASTFDVDVTDAATAAGLAVKNGLAGDSVEAFDLITAASQKVGPAMVEPLLEAANEYGTSFAAIGLSGDQAFGSLVAASADGEIALDKVGDAVKEFTIRSTDGSTASAAAYEAIGLSSDEMANKILAGGDTAAGATKQIVDGLLGITDPAAQSQAAIALFGTPLEDIGVDKIPTFLAALSDGSASLGDFAGSASELDATLGGTTAATLETLKRQFSAAFSEEIGSRALPVLQSLLGFFTEFSGPLLVVAGVLGGLAVVVGVISAATAVWAAAQSALAIATGIASGVTAAFNAVLALNPAVLITLAILALVAGLIYFFTQTETGRAIVSAAWEGIKSAVSAVADWFTGTLVPALSGAWDAIVDGVKALVSGIVADWQQAKAETAAAWEAVKGAVTGAIETAKTFVITTVAAVLTGVTGAWESVKSATTAAWDAVKTGISDRLDAAKALLSAALTAYVTLLTNAWDTVKTKTSEAWEFLKTAVGNAISAVQTAVKTGLDTVVTTAKELPGKITSGLASIAADVKVVGINVIAGVVSGIADKLGDVGAKAGEVTGKVTGALSGIAADVKSIGSNIIAGIVSGITGAVGSLKTAVVNAANSALDAAKSALGIASPSRVFRDQVGAQVAAGMAAGITKASWRAEDAAAAMAANVTSAASVKGGSVMSATSGASYSGGTAAAGPAPVVVYVQNPWTGEQVRATVVEVADERVDAAAAGAALSSRQQGRGGQGGAL